MSAGVGSDSIAITGRLVDCKKEEIFIITYCATGRRSLGRHTDGDGKRTLLITLDCRDAYGGGGTKFYPPVAKKQPFVVRPARRPRRPSRGARDDLLTPRRSAAEA